MIPALQLDKGGHDVPGALMALVDEWGAAGPWGVDGYLRLSRMARFIAAARSCGRFVPGALLAMVDDLGTVRPWGVDACLRLESAPGKKDHGRIAQFVAAARGGLVGEDSCSRRGRMARLAAAARSCGRFLPGAVMALVDELGGAGRLGRMGRFIKAEHSL
jgi:hypothetical protein